MDISAVVVAQNEAKELEAALRSLEGVVSEIIVADKFGHDDIHEIARRHGARLDRHAAADAAGQKNHAAALASHPWILCLDAGERLSPALRRELEELRVLEPACSGFSVVRESCYLGRWIRHSGWGPGRTTCLFRKGKARWEGDEGGGRLAVDGDVEKLGGPLHHLAFETISEHAAGVNKLSGLAARRLYARRRKGRILAMLVLPPLRFLSVYILKLGFLDGFPGFVIAGLEGYGTFLRLAKLRSIWKKGEHIEPLPY